jgi:hypothetical protein
MGFRLASAAFIAVFTAYLFLGGMGVTDRANPEPREAAYNLLARGLLSGHLYVARDVPPGLAALRDPYDPDANGLFRDDPRYRLHDFSYYRGRLYLYFGAAPALLVFIPWHLLTWGWLPHWAAVVLLCSAGVLVNLSLVRAVRRSAFPQAPPWADAACVLVLGFGSYGPLLAARADVWEIPIAASYLMVSVALRCLWEALSGGPRTARWIAAASAALGVAFASRPTALADAAILLVPLLSAGPRQRLRDWAAAVVPIGLCGAAVAAYNALRFGSAFDFGQRWQLASVYVARITTFSPGYVASNLRLYLLQPVRWAAPFPYAHEPPLSTLKAMLPPGHGGVEQISGLLLYAPVLWACLAVPVAVRWWGGGRRLALIAAAAAAVAVASLALLSFFFGTCSRYQFEFAPALALLASLGIVALESRPAGPARTALRCAWAAALAFTCAFTALYGIDRCVSDHNRYGVARLVQRDLDGAQAEFNTADLLSPGNPLSRLGSCMVLEATGRAEEARRSLESLVRDFPGDATARFTLANLLVRSGRRQEALEQYQAALRLDPGNDAIARALAAASGR